MKKQNRKSWTMAYCGMAAALCVALMLLGAVIPIAMFIAPALAGFLIATVCVECGRTMALTAYAAVSLLALLFVPDKEVALIFVFLLGIVLLAWKRAHGLPDEARKMFAEEFSTNDIWKHFKAVQEGRVYDLVSDLFNMSANFSYEEALKALQPMLYGEE